MKKNPGVQKQDIRNTVLRCSDFSSRFSFDLDWSSKETCIFIRISYFRKYIYLYAQLNRHQNKDQSCWAMNGLGPSRQPNGRVHFFISKTYCKNLLMSSINQGFMTRCSVTLFPYVALNLHVIF